MSNIKRRNRRPKSSFERYEENYPDYVSPEKTNVFSRRRTTLYTDLTKPERRRAMAKNRQKQEPRPSEVHGEYLHEYMDSGPESW